MRFIYILLMLIFLSGCSLNEQLFSVLKMKKADDFGIIAYEETIESSTQQRVQEILRGANWSDSKLELDKDDYPNYKFFFNKHINKIGTKIIVYSVWINPDSKKLELTKDAGSKYVQLDIDDSEILLKLITNFEY